MTNTVSVAAIAADLRGGYEHNGGMGAANALSKWLADSIVVWHVPPGIADGIMSADLINRLRRAEVEAFVAAMPDCRETGSIVVAGNDIIHDMINMGTYQGKRVTLTLPCRWTVENGKITRMGSYTTEDTPTIAEIFKASPAFLALVAELRKLRAP